MQKYPDELKHVFLWGSAGTGKTLVLVECLRIMLAKFRLEKPKEEIESIVLVYHHDVKEDSELIKYIEKKYLASFLPNGMIKPKTF